MEEGLEPGGGQGGRRRREEEADRGLLRREKRDAGEQVWPQQGGT